MHVVNIDIPKAKDNFMTRNFHIKNVLLNKVILYLFLVFCFLIIIGTAHNTFDNFKIALLESTQGITQHDLKPNGFDVVLKKDISPKIEKYLYLIYLKSGGTLKASSMTNNGTIYTIKNEGGLLMKIPRSDIQDVKKMKL